MIGRLATAAFFIGLLAASPSYAQDEGGEEEVTSDVRSPVRKTLAERIPAVTGRFFLKGGRLEVTPLVGMSMNDPFYQHFTVGASVGFHILEELSVSVAGEWYGSVNTHVVVTGGGQAVRRYNRPTYAARGDLTWAPIYGKISLMAESVLHFDTYFSASAGVVGPLRTDPEFAWGGALGQHYFLNEWLALRLEVRAQFWEMARQPSRDPTRSLQALVTGMAGVSFFLPTEFEREQIR